MSKFRPEAVAPGAGIDPAAAVLVAAEPAFVALFAAGVEDRDVRVVAVGARRDRAADAGDRIAVRRHQAGIKSVAADELGAAAAVTATSACAAAITVTAGIAMAIPIAVRAAAFRLAAAEPLPLLMGGCRFGAAGRRLLTEAAAAQRLGREAAGLREGGKAVFPASALIGHVHSSFPYMRRSNSAALFYGKEEGSVQDAK